MVLSQNQLKMCMCVKTPNYSLNITFSIRKLQRVDVFLFVTLFQTKCSLTVVNLVNYFIAISYAKTWCLNMTILLLLLAFIIFQGNYISFLASVSENKHIVEFPIDFWVNNFHCNFSFCYFSYDNKNKFPSPSFHGSETICALLMR